MGIGSLLLFLALLVLVALFVARPLFADAEADNNQLAQDSSSVQAEYERVLDALVELDADWELGKVPKEIYRGQRQQLVTKGSAALKELDQAGLVDEEAGHKALKAQPARSALTDAKLEALIAARRVKATRRRK
jgi:hypothetical protein